MSYIIEFEGFPLSRKFIFKEVTVTNLASDKYKTYFIKSSCSRKSLSVKDNKVVVFCERKLHGINWNFGFHSFISFKTFLSGIKVGEKVYTKGIQKCEYLKQLVDPGVLVINLEEIECENVSVYLKNFTPQKCALHREFHHEHCSYVKAQAFKYFLNKYESLNSEES